MANKNDEVECRACGFNADIEKFEPTASVYNDIRCPECGSTNNQHNDDYLARLQEGMRKVFER